MDVQKGRLVQRGRWWRSRTIVGAIITALGVIVAAFITNWSSGKPPRDPVRIHQHTEGPNSPAIIGTNGDVNTTIVSGQEK